MDSDQLGNKLNVTDEWLYLYSDNTLKRFLQRIGLMKKRKVSLEEYWSPVYKHIEEQMEAISGVNGVQKGPLK